MYRCHKRFPYMYFVTVFMNNKKNKVCCTFNALKTSHAKAEMTKITGNVVTLLQ